MAPVECTGEFLDWNWSSVCKFLPFDLDGFARDLGVLVRARGVAGGEALVRTLLLLGLPKSSLERASFMAREAGLAKLNTTALFKRLSASEPLLKGLFFHALRHTVEVEERWKGLRVLGVDATVLCGPGATGTDQRLHTVYDLSKGVPVSVDLTGPEGGESLWRHHCFGHGDLVIADSGHGYNRSFHHALKSGARILIRFNFLTVTLFDESGNRILVEEANAQVPETGTVERWVEMSNWPSPLRAVGARNPKGEVVWLLTDLTPEELPIQEVRELYMRRWQVELYFKRLKSLLDLNQLPTRDGPTARPWIWAKLLLATLAVLLADERFSPWGSPSPERATRLLEKVRPGRLGSVESITRTRTPTQTRAPKRNAKTTQASKAAHALEA